MRALIHARMTQKLGNFFPLSCALKEPMRSQDTTGAEKIAHSTYPDYEAIACRIGAAQGGQRRGNEQVYLDATHRIVLAGSYPAVMEQWVAEVDGQDYEILYVARSTEDATTRLECRIVR